MQHLCLIHYRRLEPTDEKALLINLNSAIAGTRSLKRTARDKAVNYQAALIGALSIVTTPISQLLLHPHYLGIKIPGYLNQILLVLHDIKDIFIG